MKKHRISISFLLLLLIISYYYNYHEIFFKRPQSVHKWRQSDNASVALNYYQGGMDLFSPETHNLTSDKGTSGKCATSEIPILYYTVAALYSVFGYHEAIFRLFNTMLFFLGLFYLFKLFYYLLKDGFWSVSLSILFFTSPVLIYYGNNFLSNSAALAFSIIGWYHFVRFLIEKQPKLFSFSMLFFLIAGSLKVTALLSFFAIAGILLLEYTGLVKLKKDEKIFNQPVKYFLSIVFVVVIIGSWLVYARNYNQKHDCTYFSTTTFPIWNLDKDGILTVLERVHNIWLEHYFHFTVFVFLGFCFAFLALNYKKNSRIFNLSILIICVEVLLYILLQFWTFADHDYYTIEIYILPVIVVSAAFYVLKSSFNNLFNSFFLKAGFAIFLLFNIWYGKKMNMERYDGWMNDYDNNKDIYSITPFLRDHGISSKDTVISIPDDSHASLYLMNQKGWTEYTDARFNRGEKIRYNQSKDGIEHSIKKGAQYLIINKIEELYKKTYLQEFCNYLIGYYNDVLVFDLRTDSINFNLKERSILKHYYCGAELLSENGQTFISSLDSVNFGNGNTQNKEIARSGKFSSQLNSDSPYGMTIRFSELQQGESFWISVWRKTEGELQGGIIASTSSNSFYRNQYKVVERDSAGWEKLETEFFISKELVGEEFGIYLYNPKQEMNYFDDFEVIRYKSVLN
jgi:hypothetical protein